MIRIECVFPIYQIEKKVIEIERRRVVPTTQYWARGGEELSGQLVFFVLTISFDKQNHHTGVWMVS